MLNAARALLGRSLRRSWSTRGPTVPAQGRSGVTLALPLVALASKSCHGGRWCAPVPWALMVFLQELLLFREHERFLEKHQR